MTIDEHIIANNVLREVSELLESPFLKEFLVNQTVKGLAKYGTTVNVEDYDVVGWIDHNIQELIDSTVYYKTAIERIIKDYVDRYNDIHIRTITLLQVGLGDNIHKLYQLVEIRNYYLEESKL